MFELVGLSLSSALDFYKVRDLLTLRSILKAKLVFISRVKHHLESGKKSFETSIVKRSLNRFFSVDP